MKKILFTIALVITMVFSVSAQDGFFRASNDNYGDRTDVSGTTPALPRGAVGSVNADQPAPLGSGLLVLMALGAGYAVRKKEK